MGPDNFPVTEVFVAETKVRAEQSSGPANN